nr:transposase [Paenibacillus fonticola]
MASEEGYNLSVRRMHEPESVFGQIKSNRGFRRFLLRGLPKVSLEVGWLFCPQPAKAGGGKSAKKKSQPRITSLGRLFFSIYCPFHKRELSLK